MSFAADIENQSLEKISLVKISPRVVVTGWALHAGSVYVADFLYGVPERVWLAIGLVNDEELAFSPNLGSIASYGAFYDAATQKLYVDSPDGDPDSFSFPGVTVSFPIHIASAQQYGCTDPLDSTTQSVEWEGKLSEIPFPTSGSSDSIFGFLPQSTGSVRVINDGWLSPFLGDFYWRNADIKAYIAVGANLAEAIENNSVRQVFLGFISAISERDGEISFECSDYLSVLDNTVATSGLIYDSATYTQVEEAAADKWMIRDVYGMVDSFRPVNLNEAAASTTNNRWWGCISGRTYPGEYLQFTLDHTKANTTQRSYFTTTPQVNVGDTLWFPEVAGPNNTAIVDFVDYDNKYVNHTTVVRAGVNPGDRARRCFIGAVCIIDRDGNKYDLLFERHYYYYTLGAVHGFSLANNFEADIGFTNSPFDPTQDKIVCRVYGLPEAGVYEDATSVLTNSNYGGMANRAAQLIYNLLVSGARIPSSLIDKTTWELAGADSAAMGFAVPENYTAQSESRSYRDLISELLSADLLNMNLISSGDAIKIGLSRIEPIVTTDFTITNEDFSDFSYSDQLRDLYSGVAVTSKVPDFDAGFTGLDLYQTLQERRASLTSSEPFSRKQTSKVYEVTTKHISELEAATYLLRISYILGTRRRLIQLTLPQKYVGESFVGKTFTIRRDLLPGYDYSETGSNEIEAVVVQVEKTIENVKLTLDDQKGIQDNAGSW